MLLNTPLSEHYPIPIHASNQRELNKIIGLNIKNLQKSTGLTQAEFLEIIGFNQKYPAQYFAKIAKGEIGVNLYTLLTIQRTFIVSLEDLITNPRS